MSVADERTDTARRLAVRNALIREGLSDMAAAAWLAAWEQQRPVPIAERDRAYWDEAFTSIVDERRKWAKRPQRSLRERP